MWYINLALENAGVAQLVEQLICNQQVGGSSPSTSSIFYSQLNKSICGSVPEWPKGADCKSVGTAFGGSNPPAPTKQIRTCESKSLFVCVCVRRTQHRFATLVANFISLADTKRGCDKSQTLLCFA